MKSWSYKQITESTEDFIRTQHQLADSNESPEGKRIDRLLAVGAQLAWSTLTTGWQTNGDQERLQALAQSVGRPKPALSDAEIY